jgi:hypothetical protein
VHETHTAEENSTTIAIDAHIVFGSFGWNRLLKGAGFDILMLQIVNNAFGRSLQ